MKSGGNEGRGFGVHREDLGPNHCLCRTLLSPRFVSVSGQLFVFDLCKSVTSVDKSPPGIASSQLKAADACVCRQVHNTPCMIVELPPAPSRALNQLLKSGVYSSPAQAVAEGLRLLRQLIDGTDQIRAGKVTSFDESAANRIKAQGRKLLAAERRTKRASGR